MHRATSSKLLVVLLAGWMSTVAVSCGGGGGGGGGVIVPGRTATFTSADSTPAPNSVSLQSAAASGDTVTIRVTVTDVTDFFGTGFRVTYNPTTVVFVSMSSTGSFLRDGGIGAANLNFTADASSPGILLISATRLQNATGTIDGVDVAASRELVTLTFRATANTGGNPFALPEPREVCDSDQPVCTEIPVAWVGGTLTAS